MAETATKYEHVALREDGVPILAGTRYKVLDLVEQKLAYGWSPEEMHFQHPDLSLGQIYSALAYSSDHAEELDRLLRHRVELADRLATAASPSPLSLRLRAEGRL
jgi:uncharacterized protein (DUF433 family)